MLLQVSEAQVKCASRIRKNEAANCFTNEMGSPVRNENSLAGPVTPKSAMRKTVRSVLAPVQSKESE